MLHMYQVLLILSDLRISDTALDGAEELVYLMDIKTLVTLK